MSIIPFANVTYIDYQGRYEIPALQQTWELAVLDPSFEHLILFHHGWGEGPAALPRDDLQNFLVTVQVVPLWPW